MPIINKNYVMTRMTQEPALSSRWKLSGSSNPGIELAGILENCKTAIGTISPNTEKVSLVSEGVEIAHNQDGKEIVINSTPVLGTYPVPHDKIDVLVGLAVHEAMHTKVDSSRINTLLKL